MSLKTILDALRKHHQDALVDLDKECAVDCWSTGHFSIDRVLGGGAPKGRIVELWGPEGSGKTTLALQTGKSVQHADLGVLYVDYEHAFDKPYAEQLGLDMSRLLVAQPNWGEQGFDIMRDAIESGGIGLVIIDSVAAITPKKEINGEEATMGEYGIGRQSMIVTQCLKQLCARISKANVSVLAINQIRSTISQGWGSGETTPGGRALKFYASIRVKIVKVGGIKKETTDGVVTSALEGQRVKFLTVKNKVCSPFREAEVSLYFGKGFDETTTLVEKAVASGIIIKSGAYFNFGEEKFKGLAAVREFIGSKPELREEIIKNAGILKNTKLPDTEGHPAPTGEV